MSALPYPEEHSRDRGIEVPSPSRIREKESRGAGQFFLYVKNTGFRPEYPRWFLFALFRRFLIFPKTKSCNKGNDQEKTPGGPGKHNIEYRRRQHRAVRGRFI